MKSQIDEMRFLTAAEVAEILRLNHQVVLRKLNQGEIEAYKIGKQWRIEERALRNWLERHSNKRSERDRILHNFFDDKGRLKSIPSKRSKRRFILEKLCEEFEHDRTYTEQEVNDILRNFHPDVCTLRREFIASKLMIRKKGLYHRCNPRPSR